MVDKLREIIDELNKDNKPVWLFACLKMDEFIDKWTLVISAPWVTESNRSEEFEKMIVLLKQKLDRQELFSIARLAFMPKDAHLVQELLKKRSGDIIRDEQLNGNKVHEGRVIESNQELEIDSSIR